jgi:hypothetical protein
MNKRPIWYNVKIRFYGNVETRLAGVLNKCNKGARMAWVCVCKQMSLKPTLIPLLSLIS